MFRIDQIALLLFLPANRLDRLPRAAETEADAVILDLEDAVAAGDKEAARRGLEASLDEVAKRKPIILRVNGAETEWHEADARFARELPISAVMLAKTESAVQCELTTSLSGKPVIALIESVHGIQNTHEIARSCKRLAFGNLDYANDLGLAQDPVALAHARSTLVFASRLAALAPPIDGVTASLDDTDRLRADAAHARDMGFGGKLLIHPGQIPTVQAAFLPTEAEVRWARKILANTGGKAGAVAVDGQMVDAPVFWRAANILRLAKPAIAR